MVLFAGVAVAVAVAMVLVIGLHPIVGGGVMLAGVCALHAPVVCVAGALGGFLHLAEGGVLVSFEAGCVCHGGSRSEVVV